MNSAEARQVIERLADGFHPYRDERLGDESVFQDPDTVRALFLAREALSHRAAIESRRRALPEQAGKSWSADEDDRLVASYEGGEDVKTIAREHQRTVAAITARLLKFGKIPDPQFQPGRPPARASENLAKQFDV